jgi:hypothetical protein
MIRYFFVIAVSTACIAVAWFGRRRYGLGRDRQKAGNVALRELYGRYRDQVSALAQARLLNAPPDEEWLATISAQATATGVGQTSGRPSTLNAERAAFSRSVIWLAGAIAALIGLEAAFFFAWRASSIVRLAAGLMSLMVFVVGIVIGVVVAVSFASRREDRRFSLRGEAPDPACQGARRVLGVWVRGERPNRAFQFDENGRVMRREQLR